MLRRKVLRAWETVGDFSGKIKVPDFLGLRAPVLSPILGKRYNSYLKRVSILLRGWRRLSLPGHEALARMLWRRFRSRLDRKGEPLRWAVAPLNSHKTGPSLEAPTEKEAWARLKVLTYVAARCENNARYEACLKHYDPSLRFFRRGIDGDSQFFGTGHGAATLDCYRMVRLRKSGRRILFEKVYSTQFADVFRTEWLEKNFGDSLRRRGVLLPEIVQQRHGARTVAVYSEFMSASRLPKKKAVGRAVEVVRALMDAMPVALKPEYRDYQHRTIYSQAYSSATSLVSRYRPESLSLFTEIATQVTEAPRRYLTHGDLHYKNMLRNGAVLDWDNCGFYPFGYDLALAFSKSMTIARGQALVAEIERNFNLSALGDRDSLLMSSLFFCFLFYSRKNGLSLDDDVIIDIFDELVAVHQRIANDHS